MIQEILVSYAKKFIEEQDPEPFQEISQAIERYYKLESNYKLESRSEYIKRATDNYDTYIIDSLLNKLIFDIKTNTVSGHEENFTALLIVFPEILDIYKYNDGYFG